MSNQIEQIRAEIEQEIAEIAELAPSCDFCHYSDLIEREEWCKEKFRHFVVAGMLAERERLMKEAPVAEVREMRGSTGDPFILTLGFQRIPNIEYHGGKVRVIIEEIKD